jgi:hypothetical protein
MSADLYNSEKCITDSGNAGLFQEKDYKYGKAAYVFLKRRLREEEKVVLISQIIP